MSETKTVNPFYNLPEDKLEIIRKDFEKGNYRSDTFEGHLKSLHEDDLIPEEVLDIIKFRSSDDEKKTFKTSDEFIKWLNG